MIAYNHFYSEHNIFHFPRATSLLRSDCRHLNKLKPKEQERMITLHNASYALHIQDVQALLAICIPGVLTPMNANTLHIAHAITLPKITKQLYLSEYD